MKTLPMPTPAADPASLVDRLAARAAADAPPPTPSADPAGDLRALLALKIGTLVADQAKGGFVDVAELVKMTNALKSLAPDDAAPDEDPDALDMSGAPMDVLEWLVEAGERSKLPKDQREAYTRQQRTSRDAEEAERSRVRREEYGRPRARPRGRG